MHLTSASEYCCLALLAIARSESEWCKRQQIVAAYAIPLPFLEQLLRKLNAAGLVVSRRGADGGFKLAIPASQITIADIVRTVDGPLAPVRSVSENFYHPTPVEASPGFHSLFRKVRDAVADILENTTLEDVLADDSRLSSRRITDGSRSQPRRAPRLARSRTRS